MQRVIVTHPVIGIAAMQVCACEDATDDEILAVCNYENPTSTKVWSSVVREAIEGDMLRNWQTIPVRCHTHPDRWHFIVLG
jgi:hypothetical protein